jgi:O-antigen ligase
MNQTAPSSSLPSGIHRGMGSIVVLALPWLNPFAPGPSPTVVPWLVSLACAALFVVVRVWQALLRLPTSAYQPFSLAAAAAGAWMLAAVLSACIALLQYFGAAAAFEPFVSTAPAGEAFGNLRQRNQFSSLCNIGLVALIWWVGSTQKSGQHRLPATHGVTGQRKGPVWQGIAWAGVAALLGVSGAASGSRTGLLQLGLVAVLVWRWGGFQNRQVRWVLLWAVGSYGIAAIALPVLAGLGWGSNGILGRVKEAVPLCSSRLVLWSNVLHLISLKPWFGWGWGELDFAHFITLYPHAPGFANQSAERFCGILDNAHNLPLHLAVECGIPTAMGACCVGVGLVWRAKPWRESDATRQMAWAVLAVILLHSLLEYPMWYGPFQMAFVICLVLLQSPAFAHGQTEHPVQTPEGWPYWKSVVALCFIAIAVLTGWDYQRVSQIYRAPEKRWAAYQSDTLQKIKNSWLFQDQVQFAELTMASVTPQNASLINAQAHRLLHFSPEAKVVQKLIDSALLLGKADEAAFFEARLQAAFPAEPAHAP